MPLFRCICFIINDLDYTRFIDIRYEFREILVYVDHIGNGLDEWWDDKINLFVSEDKSGLVDEGTPTYEGALPLMKVNLQLMEALILKGVSR